MRKPGAIVVTDRESLRSLFRKAASTKALEVSFAATRSDLRLLLGRGEIRAVLAEYRGAGSAGPDHLIWVSKHQPWIQLILMTDEPPEIIPQAPVLEKLVRIVPSPKSVKDVKTILEGIVAREQLEDTASTSPESLEFVPEKADEEIIRSITELIDQLPALPLVVQRILNLIHREDTSPKEVAEAISLDPALAARVLRLVNSALFALAEPVTTVQHAVRLLGFAEIRNLTFGLKIMDALAPEDGILDREGFWEHSLACAVCARQLATVLRKVDPEEAFMGGLLHDIGKLILDGYFQEVWSEALIKAKEQKRPPVEMETKVIGVPHTRVGRMLGEHWKIPELHLLAIEHHHGPPEALVSLSDREALLCATVNAANLLVRWLHLGSGGPSALIPLPKEIVTLLGLESGTLEAVLEGTLREVYEWKNTLGLAVGSIGRTHSAIGEGEEPCVWVIEPRSPRHPSLSALLRTITPKVEASFLGEPLLQKASQIGAQAILVDLRWARTDEQKLMKFARTLKAKTGVHVGLVGHFQLLSRMGPGEGIETLGTGAHRRVLEDWVRKVLPDRGNFAASVC